MGGTNLAHVEVTGHGRGRSLMMRSWIHKRGFKAGRERATGNELTTPTTHGKCVLYFSHQHSSLQTQCAHKDALAKESMSSQISKESIVLPPPVYLVSQKISSTPEIGQGVETWRDVAGCPNMFASSD
jgi:hypothetical protein